MNSGLDSNQIGNRRRIAAANCNEAKRNEEASVSVWSVLMKPVYESKNNRIDPSFRLVGAPVKDIFGG